MSETGGKGAAPFATRDRVLLVLLVAGAIAFGFLRGTHFENAASGGAIGDSYWTQFWLMSYQDGYIRRSLLGSLVALTLHPGSSVAVLSVCQLTISALLLATGMAIMARLMLGQGSRAMLLCAALFGFGPMGPALFETTGDPLQAAVLLYIAVMLLTSRAPEPLRIGLLSLAAILAAMIHEAAAFFVLPHLFMTLPRVRDWPTGRRTLLIAALVAAAGAAIAVLTSDSAGVPRFFLASTRDGSPIFAASLATPGFGQVMRQELHDSFGSIVAVGHFVARALRFMLVPGLVLAFMATFDRRRIALVPLFAIWVACSIPLYAIAHDWGRFGVLTLFLVLVTALADGKRVQLGRAATWIERQWDELIGRLAPSARDMRVLRIVLMGVVVSSSIVWDDYRVAGGRPTLVLAAPALLLALFIYWRRSRSDPAEASAIRA